MMFRNQLLFGEVARRKSAEEELQESQRRLADIIEFLPDATFVVDKNGTITAWNRAMANMTGIKAVEMIGKGNYEYTIPFYGDRRPALLDMVLRPDEQYLKNRYKGFSKQEDTLSAEIFVPGLKQGQGACIWVIATKLHNSEGEVIGAIESIRDISGNKAAEEALRASEQRFKEVSDLLPEAIFETDMNVTITFVNQKAVSLFGYTEQEIVNGINALEMLAPEEQDRAREIIRKRLAGQ